MRTQDKEIRMSEAETSRFATEWNAAVTRVKRSNVDLSTILIVIEEKVGKKHGKAV